MGGLRQTTDTRPARTAAKESLTDAQESVVRMAPEARVIVEAGPGTGKTETVAHRRAALLRSGLKPSEILVLSFSRNAVRTLLTRLERAGGKDPVLVEDLRHLTVRTFDSWAFRILRQCGESPAQLLRRGHDENIDALTQLLQAGETERTSAVMELLEPLRHIIVDEFQDLSGVRGALVLRLLLAVAPPARKQVGSSRSSVTRPRPSMPSACAKTGRIGSCSRPVS